MKILPLSLPFVALARFRPVSSIESKPIIIEIAIMATYLKIENPGVCPIEGFILLGATSKRLADND